MYARDTNDRSHLRRRAASTGKPSWRAIACAATGGPLQRLNASRASDRMSRAWVLRAVIAPIGEYSAGD